MKKIKIKSYCKINLSLRVYNKLRNNYHNINSLITFCYLHDVISICAIKGYKDKINFYGKFSKGIDKKSNTITKVLKQLRKRNFIKRQAFKIVIKKNIPHGSGLGGGSTNAADLINFFNLKIKKKKIYELANQIGSDVPICLKKKNTLLIGKKEKIIRMNRSFKLIVLIVYPNLICSTQKIYLRNRNFSYLRYRNKLNLNNNKQLINFLKKEKNDLQKTVVKYYPKVQRVINFMDDRKGCYFSRITGSGSACIGIFSSMKTAVQAKKMISLKFPSYWCNISKTM